MWVWLAGIALISLGISWLARKKRMEILEAQRGEAVRTKRIMEGLTSHEGWKILMVAAESQIKIRRNEINLKPTESPLSENFIKGEASGIETFMRIPTALIDEAKAIIEIANREAGTEDETSED